MCGPITVLIVPPIHVCVGSFGIALGTMNRTPGLNSVQFCLSFSTALLLLDSLSLRIRWANGSRTRVEQQRIAVQTRRALEFAQDARKGVGPHTAIFMPVRIQIPCNSSRWTSTGLPACAIVALIQGVLNADVGLLPFEKGDTGLEYHTRERYRDYLTVPAEVTRIVLKKSTCESRQRRDVFRTPANEVLVSMMANSDTITRAKDPRRFGEQPCVRNAHGSAKASVATEFQCRLVQPGQHGGLYVL